jgi:putative sterol carrier protein
MTLAEFTDEVRLSAASAPLNGKSVKLQLDLGVVHIDLTGESARVSNDDIPADAVVTTTLAVLESLSEGKTNPMMAIMTGQVKIKGDMAAALQLQSIL